MSKEHLHAFAASKYRPIIVVTVTIGIGLAMVVSVTDEYFDAQNSRTALSEELDRARETELKLPQFAKRVDALKARLLELEKMTVGELSLTQYRDQLLETIRASGCQLRSLEAGGTTRRAWVKQDDPLGPELKETKANKTPYQLEKTELTLLVDGNMSGIHKLLDSMEQHERTVFPHQVKLSSANGKRDVATLEVQMWLFALTR